MKKDTHFEKAFSLKKKNRKKIIRSALQYIILIFVLVIMIKVLFFPKKYTAYEGERSDTMDTAFIALSYFGVDRGENGALMDTTRLEEHLQGIIHSGYVSVTQQDILNYYNDKKPLPKKAVFLMFEDGRRDTAIFAQPVLEKFNLKATALTYAKNVYENDPKFLSARDLLKLKKSTYWEYGTNGFRLAFTNVFDKQGGYFDVLSSLEYQKKLSEIKSYNHYLMDYIRDENGIPKETLQEMQQRVTRDYELLRTVYTDSIGEIPKLYTIMHSNTGQFGSNDKVSAVNEQEIYDTFSMHFNREGNCENTPKSSIYDLSRLQPQPYWYTNHLLMHVLKDTKKSVEFALGDAKRAKDWEVMNGAAEFKEETIVLTSPGEENGLMCFKTSFPADVKVDVSLNGQKAGEQAIYLRADDAFTSYVGVRVLNNILYIVEKTNQKEKELYSYDLNLLTEEEPTNQEELKMSEQGVRKLSITLKNTSLYICMDKKELTTVPITLTEDGYLYLESSHRGYAGDKADVKDKVYDGVYSNLVVTAVDGEENYYDNRLTGWDAFKTGISDKVNNVVNWFIRTL